VVDSAFGPAEHFEGAAGRLARNALQSDVLQQLVATGPARLRNQLRGVLDRRDDRRFDSRLGGASGVEPGSERLRARRNTRRAPVGGIWIKSTCSRFK
jgi:hypothetical protein